MSLVEAIRTHMRECHSRMLADLLFALAQVTVVSVLFDILDESQWAFYLCMSAGVVVYFGFLTSVETTSEKR